MPRCVVARGLAIAAFLLALALPFTAFAALSLETSPGLRLAYIDPGTGSFVVQALVAAAAGIAVALKVYWQRLKGLFGFSTKTDEDDDL